MSGSPWVDKESSTNFALGQLNRLLGWSQAPKFGGTHLMFINFSSYNDVLITGTNAYDVMHTDRSAHLKRAYAHSCLS